MNISPNNIIHTQQQTTELHHQIDSYTTVTYRALSLNRCITCLYKPTRNIFNLKNTTLISYFENNFRVKNAKVAMFFKDLLDLHCHNSVNTAPNELNQT